MPTYVSDMPGLAQHFRYSQDSKFFDSAAQKFLDLSGFDRDGFGCAKTTGTLTFGTHGTNAREGLQLDNTAHLQLLPAAPYHGTRMIIGRWVSATANTTVYPLIGGWATSIASNPSVRLVSSSGAKTIRLVGAAGTITASASISSGAIFIAFLESNQVSRKNRVSLDAVTIAESAADTNTTHGNNIAPTFYTLRNDGSDSPYVRVGNLSGTIGDTAVNATDPFHLLETATFTEALLSDYPTLAQAVRAERASFYGIA